jgi:phospholipid/cholesterol/gamma-HCH transport system substrate-binding protein
MEREANYAAVGAFVLIVALVGALFVYWYSDTREHRSYQRYEIYFDGSVSGLERGAPVRYLGVNVGRVVAMSVDPRDAGRVQIIADIDSSAPISSATVAELSLQGVTGLLYVDLQTVRDNRQLIPAVPSEKYPVIRSAHSGFDVFLTSLPEVVASAGKVIERAGRLLNDSNIDALSHSFANIEKATEELPDTLHQVNALVVDLRTAARDLAATAQSTHSIVQSAGPELVAAVQHARTAADNLSEATGRLDQIIADNRQDIRSFTREGLPDLERFLRDGRAAAQEIQELSRSLRENPSQILYQAPERGVEIQR